MMRLCRRTLIPLLALAFAAPAARAQDGPPPAVVEAIQAIEGMIEATEESVLREFIARRLAPAYRASMPEAAMLAHLRTLQQAVGGPIRSAMVERTSNGLALVLTGAKEAMITFALDDVSRITVLGLGDAAARPASLEREAAREQWADLTWENLATHIRGAGTRGFRGVVLAQRNGQDLIREAFGAVDEASRRPMALNTIFDIGSTPIDFTVTATLLLAERGRIALTDPVARHLRGVPSRMQGITIEHLMTGRSGLQDFHGDREQDWDLDLAWIDRETALRRIFAQPLLFAPGEGNEHSHSAFGVLAAVIEVASGVSYREFVRTEILAPLGMTRTGFYGERGAFSVEDFAVGYAPGAVGLPNIPPNWGPTSWLVMGSGGMFSTLDDMARFYADRASGGILTGEWAARQQGPTVGIGGTDRGFFMFHVSDGRGTQVLALTASDQMPETRVMFDAIRGLILPR